MTPLFLLLAASAAPARGPAEPPDAEPAVARPLRLTFASSSAFGVTNAKFFNQLLGARFDYRFSQRFAFGSTLSYVNLKGKDGRAHNLLPEASAEYRVPLQPASVGLPVRLSLGFLPNNGPTFRIAAGFDFQLSEAVTLELTPVEPMLWVTREKPELSLNGTAALRVAF
jgi:hypothetical protein